MTASNNSSGGWPGVMIDIETLATTDDAVILEMGAVCFDRERRLVGEGFAMTLDYLDQPGRRVDLETVMWWTAPERMPRFREMQENHATRPGLWHGLQELAEFLTRHLRPDAEVWAKGDFDLRILKDAFGQFEMPVPWEYYQARELRTVMKWTGVKASGPVPHSAVHDARLQVETLFACEERLNGWAGDYEAGWAAYRANLAETRGMLLPEWAVLPEDVRESFCAGVMAAVVSNSNRIAS